MEGVLDIITFNPVTSAFLKLWMFRFLGCTRNLHQSSSFGLSRVKFGNHGNQTLLVCQLKTYLYAFQQAYIHRARSVNANNTITLLKNVLPTELSRHYREIN